MDELDAGHARADDDEVLGPLASAGRRPVVERTRSPSTSAQSGRRGRLPVESSDGVGLQLDDALLGLGDDLVRARQPPGAAEHAHALAVEELAYAVARACARSTRCRFAERVGVEPLTAAGSSPISVARPMAARAPPVAIIALDGMQSHRWAAPPITSFSTT